MRDLDVSELDQVSGGWGDPYELDDVFVNGQRYTFASTYTYYVPIYGYTYSNYYEYSGGGGGGGGGIWTITDTPPQTNCEVERAVDAAAYAAAGVFQSLPYYNSREYASLVVRDVSGNLFTTNIYIGGPDRVNLTNAVHQYGAANIVGIIHSHPDGPFDNAEDVRNRYLSDGDWDVAQQLVSMGANSQTFSMYIVDYQGKVREYDYRDGKPTAPTGEVVVGGPCT